ncbi:MAG: nuclear transport factor 2 family protein [Bacteroidota bacterium]
MRNLLLIPLLLIGCFLTAQSERAAVVSTIEQLFDGMRQADTTLVSAVLHPEIRLQTIIVDSNGVTQLQTGTAERFLTGIAQYPAGTLDEQLYSRQIELDGPLATAWTTYTFFAGGQLSHCGTNAFQLMHTTAGWKIHQITDTRRRTGCLTSPVALRDTLNDFIDQWHHAAAVADEEIFFGAMAEDGIYLGTDATERWLRDELRTWAAFAFERESAWSFTAYDRQLYFTDNNTYAWWEEMLETWMGPCRASGVAQWQDGRWQIKHYHLAVTVPNEKMDGFRALIKP